VELDERWYDGLKLNYWHDASWRDPWVMPDPEKNGFHMLVTCRVNRGEPDGRGAIGHATSTNLLDWEVKDAWLAPGWFGEMEVPQIEKIGDYYYLFCSVSTRFHSAAHRSTINYEPQTGVKYFIADYFSGPYRCLGNGFLTETPQGLYSSRIIKDPEGHWALMAFKDKNEDGIFQGIIIDPIRIHIHVDGRLSLAS
jgi:beta-fructofuranosidase